MPSSKLLIIGFVWPEPTSSAAGYRSLDLVETFLESGYEVVFASPSPFNSFSEALSEQGVIVQQIFPNDSSFDEWVKELAPDVVLYDRFMMEEMFGSRVREQVPQALRLLDTQDLHFLRRTRQSWVEKNGALPELGLDFHNDDTFREIASIHRCDLTLLISSFEKGLLEADFGVPSKHTSIYRFNYPPRTPVPSAPEEEGDEGRSNFVIIGNFRHPPNLDAFHWLRLEIWPLIRARLPDAEVHVYGAYPPKEVMALDSPKTGFRVLGTAKDQYKTLSKYRVSLAPLRFGAGIKGKITDSWYVGTPVVTTPIGAEGMCDELSSFPGKVAATAADFAQLACEVYLDSNERSRLRTEGWRLLDQSYERTSNRNTLMKMIEEARVDLDRKRSANFLGRLLEYHQFRSTTYFSRWIELKNSVKNSK